MLRTIPTTASTQPEKDFSGVVDIMREFIVRQPPSLETLRKADTPERKALRAYEAQRSVGVRAFSKIKTGDWLELRRMDGPNALVFVTDVYGMKRWPAVAVVHCKQDKVAYARAQRIDAESVVAIHNTHPALSKGTPFGLLGSVTKAFGAQTCLIERDANAGTYFKLALGSAKSLTLDTVEEAVRYTFWNAGFDNITRIPHPKTGVPQWYARGKNYNVRVRLCGTVANASIEVDFAQREKSGFRRK